MGTPNGRSRSYVWTAEGGFQPLPNLSGYTSLTVWSLSFDGSTAVGDPAFIWTRSNGTRALFQVFAHAGLPVAGVFPYGNLFFVDYAGLQFAGAGYTAGSPTFIWHATLSAGATCYANCDLSTTTPYLTVADFSCFLNRSEERRVGKECR